MANRTTDSTLNRSMCWRRNPIRLWAHLDWSGVISFVIVDRIKFIVWTMPSMRRVTDAV
jgi:hypothetical protein